MAEMLCECGLDTQAVPRAMIHQLLWRKLAVNCIISPITALTRVPNGALHGMHTMIEPLAQEICSIAAAHGVSIDPRELVGQVDVVAQATKSNRSSMLVDLTKEEPCHSEVSHSYAAGLIPKVVVGGLHQRIYQEGWLGGRDSITIK